MNGRGTWKIYECPRCMNREIILQRGRSRPKCKEVACRHKRIYNLRPTMMVIGWILNMDTPKPIPCAREDFKEHIKEGKPVRHPFHASAKPWPEYKLTWSEASHYWEVKEYRIYEKEWNRLAWKEYEKSQTEHPLRRPVAGRFFRPS